jgi:hypothetical protein
MQPHIKNKYIFKDDETIDLVITSVKKGVFRFIIDSDDYNRVRSHTWMVKVSASGKPYAKCYIGSLKRGGNRWQIYLHSLVTSFEYEITDHINRITSDNRKVNLRGATNTQNIVNKGPVGWVKYKGVSKPKTYNKYVAIIYANNKSFKIGAYDTAEEAALAYNKKSKEIYGEFGYQNQIES